MIKAPSSGQLTFLDAKVGESKRNGQRIGQVDLIENYKVSAQVDEFYINRVSRGQKATFELNQQQYSLSILKIYPGIENGSFKVDFSIDEPSVLSNLRLGQSLQLKYNLSDATSTLQLANGGFLQNTAGNWAYVLTNDGMQATRRAVRLGKKNPQSIEVISGLRAGDKVITSSYSSFIDAELLHIEN